MNAIWQWIMNAIWPPVKNCECCVCALSSSTNTRWFLQSSERCIQRLGFLDLQNPFVAPWGFSSQKTRPEAQIPMKKTSGRRPWVELQHDSLLPRDWIVTCLWLFVACFSDDSGNFAPRLQSRVFEAVDWAVRSVSKRKQLCGHWCFLPL